MIRYFQLRRTWDPNPNSNHDHLDEQLDGLTEKVFQNPVILEVILMHALQQGGHLCTQQARRLRLVSKTWLLQINCIFQRLGEPLTFLYGTNLKEFLEFCDIRCWTTPPISLSLESKDLLLPDFYEHFSKFFMKGYLVAKLTNLRISEPYTFGEALAENFRDPAFGLHNFPSHFKLTNLRKIWLKQLEPSGTDGVADEKKRIPRLEEFVGQVLNQSVILEEFNFEGGVWPECPLGQYEGLILPGTVARVQLDTRMNLTKILAGVALEGITTLKLTVTSRNSFGRGELEGILEGVKMSLECLAMDDVYSLGWDDVEVVLKFPVMENLRKMMIGGRLWRVARSQVLNGLGERFPVLEELEFGNDFVNELLLNDWCGDNSVFGKVTTLTLKLIQDMGAFVEMSETKMRRILKTFPNVEKLWMEGLDVGEGEGMRFMFGELGGQLRSLHLELRGSLEREEVVEGILIGGDVEMVRRLKSKRKWKEFLDGGNGGYKSLRDLVKLEELVLMVYPRRRLTYNFRNRWWWRVVGWPDIYDFKFRCEILFEVGFMRMPNLRRLELHGGFSPGKDLVKKWKRQGEGNGEGGKEMEFDRILELHNHWGNGRKWRGRDVAAMVCCALVIIWGLGRIMGESWNIIRADEEMPKMNSDERLEF